MPNYQVTPEQIDALLPQTQCRECGYQGCLPYAKAIINNNEALDRCLPGGVPVLQQLGDLLNQNISAAIPKVAAKEPPVQLAKIREQECIGCTKCIQACPVDAIIGTGKHMHTVIARECTGCELCVPVCPVDCIDLISCEQLEYQPTQARSRYFAKQRRQVSAHVQQDLDNQRQRSLQNTAVTTGQSAKQAFIEAALMRAQLKREKNTTDE